MDTSPVSTWTKVFNPVNNHHLDKQYPLHFLEQWLRNLRSFLFPSYSADSVWRPVESVFPCAVTLINPHTDHLSHGSTVCAPCPFTLSLRIFWNFSSTFFSKVFDLCPLPSCNLSLFQKDFLTCKEHYLGISHQILIKLCFLELVHWNTSS